MRRAKAEARRNGGPEICWATRMTDGTVNPDINPWNGRRFASDDFLLNGVGKVV